VTAEDEASDEQIVRIANLAADFARMRDRSVTETMAALLSCRTLATLGYDGSGHLTKKQARAAEQILTGWIRRSA
jgi:hypothetical protein